MEIVFGNITCSYATGDVNVDNSYGSGAGFVDSYTGTIENAYSTGDVKGKQQIYNNEVGRIRGNNFLGNDKKCICFR